MFCHSNVFPESAGGGVASQVAQDGSGGSVMQPGFGIGSSSGISCDGPHTTGGLHATGIGGGPNGSQGGGVDGVVMCQSPDAAVTSCGHVHVLRSLH